MARAELARLVADVTLEAFDVEDVRVRRRQRHGLRAREVAGLVVAVRLRADGPAPEDAAVALFKGEARGDVGDRLREAAPLGEVVEVAVRHEDAALVVAVALRDDEPRERRRVLLAELRLGLHAVQAHVRRRRAALAHELVLAVEAVGVPLPLVRDVVERRALHDGLDEFDVVHALFLEQQAPVDDEPVADDEHEAVGVAQDLEQERLGGVEGRRPLVERHGPVQLLLDERVPAPALGLDLRLPGAERAAGQHQQQRAAGPRHGRGDGGLLSCELCLKKYSHAPEVKARARR